MSPMWLSPTWLDPSAATDGATARSGGSVPSAVGVKSSRVRSRPPCQENTQPSPSLVAPCERPSASCPRNVSVPTSLQPVVQRAAALAGAARHRAAASTVRARRIWEQERRRGRVLAYAAPKSSSSASGGAAVACAGLARPSRSRAPYGVLLRALAVASARAIAAFLLAAAVASAAAGGAAPSPRSWRGAPPRAAPAPPLQRPRCAPAAPASGRPR